MSLLSLGRIATAAPTCGNPSRLHHCRSRRQRRSLCATDDMSECWWGRVLQHAIWQELDTTLEVLGMQASMATNSAPRNPTSRASGPGGESERARKRWGMLSTQHTGSALSRRRASSPQMTNRRVNATQSYLLSSHRPPPPIAEDGVVVLEGRPPLSPTPTLATPSGSAASVVEAAAVLLDTADPAHSEPRSVLASPTSGNATLDASAAFALARASGFTSSSSSRVSPLRPDAPAWMGLEKAAERRLPTVRRPAEYNQPLRTLWLSVALLGSDTVRV